MSVVEKIKSALGISQETCQAIVNENENRTCNNKVYGQGYTQGYNIKFCSKHTPSDAIPSFGRVDPVKFYIPDKDSTIEVE